MKSLHNVSENQRALQTCQGRHKTCAVRFLVTSTLQQPRRNWEHNKSEHVHLRLPYPHLLKTLKIREEREKESSQNKLKPWPHTSDSNVWSNLTEQGSFSSWERRKKKKATVSNVRLAQQCHDKLQNSTLALAAPSRPVPARPRGPSGPQRLPLTKESGSAPSIPHLITARRCTRMGASERASKRGRCYPTHYPPRLRRGLVEPRVPQAYLSQSCGFLPGARVATHRPGEQGAFRRSTASPRRKQAC